MNQLVEKERLSPRSAINVATDVHTIPPAFAVVMKQIEPRMAVAYHFFNDFDTRFPMYDEIRSVYKGPLTMASDLIVWNISRQAVRVRQIVVNDNSWPPKPPTAAGQPDPKEKTQLTPFIESGRLNMDSVLTPEIDKFKKDHGMN
jgi:ribonuclease Z